MDSIEKLINLFRKFPTVGPRTAHRFVFYLINQPKEKIDELISALSELKNNIKLCQFCFLPFEPLDTAQGKDDLCPICKNPARNKDLLCVVEKENDLISIENTKKYNGLYFILGGTVQALRSEDISKLRIDDLKKRIRNNKFSEIIIAINPTVEGKATSMLIERELKSLQGSWKITHLAQGLPVGGELEYTDEETLESAFEGRK